ANRGGTAQTAVERLERKFLMDPPGPWLPDEFLSPHELLERSITNASDTGRKILIRGVHRILKRLFSEFSVRILSESESRELLGALCIAALHPSPGEKNLACLNLLYFAINRPAIFWEKVRPIEDIVGKATASRQALMIQLWEKIPETERLYFERMRVKPKAPASFLHKLVSSLTRSKLFFDQALGEGKPVEVIMRVNGRSRKTGLICTPSKEAIYFSSQTLRRTFKGRIASWNGGDFSLKDESERNIGNAVKTRIGCHDTARSKRVMAS
ncbi:MAG: hypothetical protein ABL921_31120, partial [Pirellula sp.]